MGNVLSTRLIDQKKNKVTSHKNDSLKFRYLLIPSMVLHSPARNPCYV